MTRKGTLPREPHEICAVCGLLRINVSHTEDIDNAPEGRDYYEQNVKDRHKFVPTGRYSGGYTAIEKEGI